MLLSICVSAGFWSLAGESESHVSGHWVAESTEMGECTDATSERKLNGVPVFQKSHERVHAKWHLGDGGVQSQD